MGRSPGSQITYEPNNNEFGILEAVMNRRGYVWCEYTGEWVKQNRY